MVKMSIVRALMAAVILIAAVWNSAFAVCAEQAAEDLAAGFGAESVYIGEMTTDHCISESNADKQIPMGHFAKLMTVLICAEELEKGTVSLDEEVIASAYANSMPSPQIWLREGERVTVEDLIKSITIGNANDACAALSERLSGSAENHISRINDKARTLGMEQTYYADINGLSQETVSTAKDMYIMIKNIVKHNNMTAYFTTWLDNVKRQEVELVNNNRLVRSYKGCTGVKALGRQDGRYSLICTVSRRNMSVCAVICNGLNKDDVYSIASNSLDDIFDDFRVYCPEQADEIPESTEIQGGRKLSICVKQNYFTGVFLRRDEISSVKYEISLPESVQAPVFRGDELGRIVYTLNGEKIAEVGICAAETVEKMDMTYAIHQCLCNLFNM